MLNDPKAVANYILDCAKENGELLSPMKLNKLVYLAHGWTLGLTGNPLIKENPEAWRYGPVIPSLYHDLKEFGNEVIDRYTRWTDWGGGQPSFTEPQLSRNTDRTELSIIRKVWSAYKRFDAMQLSALTHEQGTPWYITWHDNGGKDRLGVDIPDDLIKEHYKNRVGTTG